MSKSMAAFMDRVVARNPGEPEFHQAIREVAESVMPVVERLPPIGRKKYWSAWWNRSGSSVSGCHGWMIAARFMSTAGFGLK